MGLTIDALPLTMTGQVALQGEEQQSTAIQAIEAPYRDDSAAEEAPVLTSEPLYPDDNHAGELRQGATAGPSRHHPIDEEQATTADESANPDEHQE